RRKILLHPFGGLVLRGTRRLPGRTGSDSVTHEDDSASEGVPVTLADHSEHVCDRAGGFARDIGFPEELTHDIQIAATLHDLGKADPRFQVLLHDGNILQAQLSGRLLAKSNGMPRSRNARRRTRQRSGLPTGFRHELLSVRLAENAASLLAKAHDPDLVLHLIAAHHGRCRPFAPVIPDEAPQDVSVNIDGTHFSYAPRADIASGHGLERLDSGVAERFWRLVRRYGWWGLAYLEAVLILADHRASEAEEQNGQTDARASQPQLQRAQEDSK
ncbi:MAG: CRISPR-associated endonuclease Cas3'', partial [Dehalococcoidia bacterium]